MDDSVSNRWGWLNAHPIILLIAKSEGLENSKWGNGSDCILAHYKASNFNCCRLIQHCHWFPRTNHKSYQAGFPLSSTPWSSSWPPAWPPWKQSTMAVHSLPFSGKKQPAQAMRKITRPSDKVRRISSSYSASDGLSLKKAQYHDAASRLESWKRDAWARNSNDKDTLTRRRKAEL